MAGRVHPSNIDRPNWGSEALQSFLKTTSIMLKNSARIQATQEEYGVVHKLNVLWTAGNCMLLRRKVKQELIPMKFFFWKRKVCQHKVIRVFIWRRNVWGEFEIMILTWYFYSSHWIFFPILSTNGNSIQAPFWCVLYVLQPLSFFLSVILK